MNRWIRFVQAPATRIVLDIFLVVFLALGAWNSYQIRDAQENLNAEVAQRQAASYHNCQAANDSRQVIVNLLRAGEHATRQSPPSARRRAAITFYEQQIHAITFSDCSVYKP